MWRCLVVGAVAFLAGCQTSLQRDYSSNPAAQAVSIEQIPYPEAEHLRNTKSPGVARAEYWTTKIPPDDPEWRMACGLKGAKVGATRVRYGARMIDPGRSVAIGGDTRINQAVNVNSPYSTAYNNPSSQMNGGIVDTSGWMSSFNQGAAIGQRQAAIEASRPTWEYIFVYYK